jgi:glycosyltransferase involved in cell wall biosynthesis
MIEAAAFGLPLITTNVCGMADFVRQGENGLTVPVGDPAALAHAISRLVDDPSLICNLGKAAFQTANEHSWPQAAANMVKGYQRAVDA